MAKTLNQFLEGYLKVKNPDEQKFVDKHVVAKHADRNGNGDEVFKGSKVKMDDRRKTRHGYNPGEDEKVYEELKGSQHKIDANKNGKVDAHDFQLLRKKKKVAEEAEDLDEAALKQAEDRHFEKQSPKMQAAINLHLRKGKDYQDAVAAAKRHVKEEVEELEELSKGKLTDYRTAAKKQGTGIQDKMKIGGGDWSKDGKDTSTLKKRLAGYKMAGRKTNPDLAASVGKAPRVAATEEVQIDEISSGLAQRYLQKKRERDYNTSADGTTHTLKKPTTLNRLNRDIKGTVRALKTIEKAKKTNEEAEQIDETAKIVAHLQKRYGDNIRKSHVVSAANDFGVDASKLAKAVRTKLGKNMLGEEQIDEISAMTKDSYAQKASKQLPGLFKKSGESADAARKYYNRKNTVRKIANEEAEQVDEKLNMDKASMGDVITDFKDSNAPQFKGKSQDKRRAMAIAAKLTAERGGKPLRKEEKLADLLGDLTETHRRTMLSVFDKLNEDNQKKFLEACETLEGVESMLDFSISHRGE